MKRHASDDPAQTPVAVPGRRLLIFLVLFTGTLVGSAVGFLLFILREAPGELGDPPVIVVIERGWSLGRIARELDAAGVVADYRGFILLAKKERVATALRAGEYSFQRGLPLHQVLGMVAAGRTVRHTFTVLPGETAYQVARKLELSGLDDRGLAEKLIVDEVFAARLGVPARRLEGFLFPETYTYERGTKAKRMLELMVDQFHRNWRENLADRARGVKLTQLQIVTLASIIERETADKPERPKIARVFLNRLRIGMSLQADPTVIYSLGPRFRGKLTRAHLRWDHPYNTYTRKGLPPGPIASPSLDSMTAVLQPADGNWKYFVSTNRGNHVFSETYKQHSTAVNKYQRGRK